MCQSVDFWNAWPRRSTVVSSNARPASCSDTGRPDVENPHGSASVGWPVRLNGGMLLRGNASSGSYATLNGVAGFGAVGVASTSNTLGLHVLGTRHERAALESPAQHVAVELGMLAQVALVIGELVRDQLAEQHRAGVSSLRTTETRPIPLQTYREAPGRRAECDSALPVEDEQQQQQ